MDVVNSWKRRKYTQKMRIWQNTYRKNENEKKKDRMDLGFGSKIMSTDNIGPRRPQMVSHLLYVCTRVHKFMYYNMLKIIAVI